MWIVLRLVLAAIGFVVRQVSRRKRQGSSPGTHDGVPYFEKIRTHKKEIQGFRIGMARRSPTWVRLHPESRTDRFFKAIGIASEAQSGDARFDERVYVTCDHPHVHTALREEPELRAAITAAFDEGFHRIELDGETLWLDKRATHIPTEVDRKRLGALYRASATLEEEPPSRLRDRFLWKTFVVEGLIWSILGYAIGAFAEMVAHKEDYHLWPSDVAVAGIVVAIVAFVVLLVVITLWMRGSSRGHRIIVESAIVLLFGLPVASIQVVGDTNRRLDDAPSIFVTRTVRECEVREHRGRKGRRWYSYHVWLKAEPERDGPRLPEEIQVSRTLCDGAMGGAEITFEIGRGRWGIPWYRSIRVRNESWTAP
jgi:hypothetical protein